MPVPLSFEFLKLGRYGYRKLFAKVCNQIKKRCKVAARKVCEKILFFVCQKHGWESCLLNEIYFVISN